MLFAIDSGWLAHGGGVNGNSAQAEIANCVIEDNYSDYDGGGIFDFDGDIINCVITGNIAAQRGGGLADCDGTIINCIIAGNEAANGGGLDNCDGDIFNCTIADNEATTAVGGLRNCDAAITNTIIWYNGGANYADQISGGVQVINYSCIQGWSSGGGTGNNGDDPDFVGGNDYHIGVDSSCIDTGDSSYDYSGMVDLDGNPRVIDAYGVGDDNVDVDRGAYELDPPVPGSAGNPYPSNGATSISRNADMSWTGGSNATSHDVYFGTSNPPSSQGNQGGTSYDPGTMQYSTTYYWRIDEVGPGGVTSGTVWNFTTESYPAPGSASNPSPSSGATGVLVGSDLSWTAGSDTTSHDVYFGTSNPPSSQGNQGGTSYDPGTMQYSTTYYWRIDEVGPGGTTTGSVWNFTTEDPPCLSHCYVDNSANPSWPNVFTDIQSALNSVCEGGTIWVADGTYVLSVELEPQDDVMIYGGFDGDEVLGTFDLSNRNFVANETIIDGDNVASIRCFDLNFDCTIDGFTITNAGSGYSNPGTGIACFAGSTITNCNITNNGTGISCNLSSSPAISNCTFSGNGETWFTGYQGGGISIDDSSSPTITNCEFSQNVAGGIDCSSSSGTISISGCEFSSNSSGKGGAIHCSTSSPTISDCEFTGNGADTVSASGGDGGAIYCFDSSPTIEDCVFTDNTADRDGGAICCVSSSSASSPKIERCVFSGNTAEDDGGGLCAINSDSEPKVINCLFINNEAENGGGIAIRESSGSSVINCTFYGNASLGTYSNRGGGAVYAKASFGNYCSTTMTNCILWGNTAANDGHEVCCDGDSSTFKAVVTLKYCDIQDTTGWMLEVDDNGDDSEVRYLPYSTYKNIYDNPTFENPAIPKGGDNEWATSDDGFMIQSTSECRNKGDDVTGSPHYISEDITGNDRKIGIKVDIGAYEYDPN